MAAIPSQIVTWMHGNVGDLDGPPVPQFLYALRDTRGGDRQIVWEGGGGRGLIAVVDFADAKLHVNGRWRSWGVTTPLEAPVSILELRADPILGQRFAGNGLKALQGLPKRVTTEQARAIDHLAGGLPEQRLPDRPPHVGDPIDDWFGSIDIDPEKTFELAVHTSKHLWKRIGFPERPVMQQRLAQTATGGALLIPDLIAPGVVGEVKRALKPNDPAQLIGYITRLTETRATSGPWRGILIHGGELSQAVRDQLVALHHDIQVWGGQQRGRQWRAGREWKATRQFP